jgi:hypothetical protein
LHGAKWALKKTERRLHEAKTPLNDTESPPRDAGQGWNEMIVALMRARMRLKEEKWVLNQTETAPRDAGQVLNESNGQLHEGEGRLNPLRARLLCGSSRLQVTPTTSSRMGTAPDGL